MPTMLRRSILPLALALAFLGGCYPWATKGGPGKAALRLGFTVE
jgi:hypothetical protein